MPVFRFGVRAQPTISNPKYATWQTADLTAFIVADDGPAAETKFETKVKKLHWKILEWKLRDQLIEERIREAGGEVLAAYDLALKRGEWYRVDSEHFMADAIARNPMSVSSRRWKGGIILLNSGYCSPSHDVFEQVAADAVRNSKYIQLLVCITTRAQTNGFDCYMNWEFSPKHHRIATEEKIFKAYDYALHEVMGLWVSGGLRRATPHQPLAEPVSFEYGGKIFAWDPGIAPFSSSQIAEVMRPAH